MKGEMIAWTGTKTVVLGMGRSGQAAAEWLFAQKAEVTVFDESKSAGVKDLARRWEARGALAVIGQEKLPHARFARAILSPGIDPKRPVVGQLRSAKVPMFGELELGARACLCPILAITGTNGKSTTTELIAAILQAAGKKAVACLRGGRGQLLPAGDHRDVPAPHRRPSQPHARSSRPVRRREGICGREKSDFRKPDQRGCGRHPTRALPAETRRPHGDLLRHRWIRGLCVARWLAVRRRRPGDAAG
ncbi:hypothetical protein EBT11_04145 [bacterium]|nr:hypothetical protein [bacterium]